MRNAHGVQHKDQVAHEFSAAASARSVRIHRWSRTLELDADGGSFESGEQWWYGFEYEHERDRGYDCQEDLFSPGVFHFQARPGREVNLTITAWIGERPGSPIEDERRDHERLQSLAAAATKRLAPDVSAEDRDTTARMALASDAYVVRRGAGPDAGTSIIAGYPWFSDWGRDSMISLPGLLLATARYAEARGVLETFAGHRRRGLIPNLFNDQTGEAEYNTVDASLWFIHAACEYLRLSGDRPGFGGQIQSACLDIVEAYRGGTDFGIGMDPADGLVTAGDESTQLTWMDAKRDGHAFTPRQGKAVEINALWYHGLMSLAEAIERQLPERAAGCRSLADRAGRSFATGFWNPAAGCCFDVLVPSASSQGTKWTPDPRIRPNQVFAASLRHSPLNAKQRAGVIASIRQKLLTPYGLRTLDPADPGYRPRYRGQMWERDGAYHNGTVWPWLLGPYAEAVVRLDAFSSASRREARQLMRPLLDDMSSGQCLGQIAEVFDAEPPRGAGGCPAQAWSVAELLRVWLLTLGPADAGPSSAARHPSP
jgi:predicted glycogen debranching enzyme